jgi:sugar lactone lactonase YvrE
MKLLAAALVLAASAFAQGIVTTVAGTDYIFPDDGKPALQAHLAGPRACALDAKGNLYVADFDLAMVLKISPDGVIHIFAGNGLTRFAGDGGPAVAASIAGTAGVAVAPSGDVYIAEQNSSVVRRVAPNGIITTFAGGGTVSPGDGGAATSALLQQPTGVAVDAAGNLYIAELLGHRVRKVTPAGIISTVAGNGQGLTAGDGAAATSASIYRPAAVALDSSGNIYVAETLGFRVRRVAPNGIISTVAGGGSDGSGGTGSATNAFLNQPSGVAIGPAGDLYITELVGHRVRQVTTRGAISTIAGNGTAGFSGDGGLAINAMVARPYGVAVDSAGAVYIADRDNGRIRQVNSAGTITTFAGQGAFLGDGGAAAEARLASPLYTALDVAGNLYVSDNENVLIRKVTPGGIISTIAGTGISTYSGDGGPATNAALNFPAGMTFDSAGNLYIADQGNERIRRITPSGTISTVAGNGNGTFAGDGGQASQASLWAPSNIAFDPSGNLLICDTSNNRIRRVTPGGIISTVAGNGSTGFPADGATAINAPLGLILDNGIPAGSWSTPQAISISRNLQQSRPKTGPQGDNHHRRRQRAKRRRGRWLAGHGGVRGRAARAGH